MIEAMKMTKGYILLATYQLVGEGFDLPNLETMLMASPYGGKGRTTQYIGRLHRSYEDKTEVTVYDYIDHRVDWLSAQYNKRLKVYTKQSYVIRQEGHNTPMIQYVYDYDSYKKQLGLNIIAT